MALYSTSQLARLAGVHPNTVRLYEQWGFISPVPRTPAGYRRFCGRHLLELRFARLALPGPYPARKDLLPAAVRAYCRQDYGEARLLTAAYDAAVAQEQQHAREALAVLDRWHQGHRLQGAPVRGGRRQMAQRCHVTVDALRTWERNGILTPAQTAGGRMAYTAEDVDTILVVRLLRRRGFSLASLQQVFSGAAGPALPSDYLTRIYLNRESACEAGQWMAHLDAHRRRARLLLAHLDTEHPASS